MESMVLWTFIDMEEEENVRIIFSIAGELRTYNPRNIKWSVNS
jgi:hypothetical protein